jgi:hypothetical protein
MNVLSISRADPPASRADPPANKRASGRAQDLADIEALDA